VENEFSRTFKQFDTAEFHTIVRVIQVEDDIKRFIRSVPIPDRHRLGDVVVRVPVNAQRANTGGMTRWFGLTVRANGVGVVVAYRTDIFNADITFSHIDLTFLALFLQYPIESRQ
jgi:hypothetical protein